MINSIVEFATMPSEVYNQPKPVDSIVDDLAMEALEANATTRRVENNNGGGTGGVGGAGAVEDDNDIVCATNQLVVLGPFGIFWGEEDHQRFDWMPSIAKCDPQTPRGLQYTNAAPSKRWKLQILS
jgi:hypothetical protein